MKLAFVGIILSISMWGAKIYTVCPSGCNYTDPNAAESALSSIVPTWPILDQDYIFEWTAGATFSEQLVLVAPNNSQAPFTCIETQGSSSLSCRAYYDPTGGVTMCAGMAVAGPGIAGGTTVSTVGGSATCPPTSPAISGGYYAVVLSANATPPSPLCGWNGSSVVCTQQEALTFGAAHWIIHRSSAVCAQPGNRAGPVDTSTGTGVYTGMAKLMNAINNQTTVTVASTGVSYHRFECVEIASNPSLTEPYNIISLFYQGTGSPGSSENQISQLVHHIVFNQDYLHHHLDSNAANVLGTVLYPDPQYMEVTNSTIMVFHPDTESHDFGSPTALGPLYMRNNEFESSQIATLTGGNASGISGMKSTGGQWIGNYYYRPWLWRVSSSTVDPGNTFFPSTCMYDSVGGESFINSTSGHWWLCVSGTWTDQGVGTPSVPYCQVSGTCDTTQASTHVCTSVASSTALTCLDTTGISNGQFITAAPFVGTGAFVSTVNNMTSITTTQPANWGAEMSMTFSTPGNPDGGVPFCNNGCSIDKNQFELKNAFGNIAEGNWIQNGWQPTMLGQTGECVLMNQIDGPVGEPWAGEMYTTFKNNRCDSTSGGWVNAASGTAYNWINRGLNITNNLFTNVGLQQLTGTNTGSPTNSTFQLNLGNWLDESLDHNTTLLNNSVAGFLGFGSEYCGSSLPPSTVIGFMSWTNSIFNAGQGVWSASCGPANGFNPFAFSFTWATSNFLDDIAITTQSPCQPNGSGGNCGEYQFSNNPCNGCQYPTSLSTVFQSYPTNLAVSSTYQRTGYLGTDPGADIQVVNWSTQGNSGCPGSTPCGAPNPYLDFRVNAMVAGTSWVGRYVAPDTGTCTLHVAANSGFSPEFSGYPITDTGGNPDRPLAVTGLNASTRYWWKMICGSSTYRRSDTFITASDPVEWTLIQHAYTFQCGATPCTLSTTSSGAHTVPIVTTTAGNLVVALVSFYATNSTSPLTSSAISGDTFVPCPTNWPAMLNFNANEWDGADCYYVLASGADSSFTWTGTWAGGAGGQGVDLEIFEFHRSAGTAIYDTSAVLTSTTCGLNCVAPVPSRFSGRNAEVCVQGIAVNQMTVTAISSAYSPLDSDALNVYGAFSSNTDVVMYSAPVWSGTTTGADSGNVMSVVCWK